MSRRYASAWLHERADDADKQSKYGNNMEAAWTVRKNIFRYLNVLTREKVTLSEGQRDCIEEQVHSLASQYENVWCHRLRTEIFALATYMNTCVR